MKLGLKQTLNKLIQDEGYLTLDQVYQIAENLGHKQKTAERVLNPSLSPNVVTLKNESHQITGYKWGGEKVQDGWWNESRYQKVKEISIPSNGLF